MTTHERVAVQAAPLFADKLTEREILVRTEYFSGK